MKQNEGKLIGLVTSCEGTAL